MKTRYVLMLMGVWLVFLMEFLSRSSVRGSLQWSYSNIPAFLMNSILLASLILLFTAITGRTRWSYWIVFTIVFVLSFISGVKLRILGIPLLPWDFIMTGETGDMTQYISNIFNGSLVASILLFMGASIGLLYYIPETVKKIRGKERVLFAVGGILLIFAIYIQPKVVMEGLFGIEDKPWNQKDNVTSNGFMLATMFNLDQLRISELDGYDRSSVAAIIDHPSWQNDDSSVKPNIVIILGEAFWDPTVIPGLTFSRDPIPNFRQLSKQFSSGYMLSPQYGGGTTNVEFEVLTGNSMRFMPQGSFPFNQHFNRGVDSIASIASRQGYYSTVINPFHSWFYEGQEVYKYMGFDKHISIEFFNQVFSGPYIADDEVANVIIREMESTEGPDLVFAKTIENHYHFWPGKFPENTIQIEGVDGDARALLETLAQGIQATDQMLKKLTDYFNQSEEPTIMVFFSDHLPSLGDNYSAYIDANYISGTDDPDFLEKMFNVPLLIWNNYLTEDREDLYMSPSFVTPYILNKTNLQGTYYTDFLHNLYQDIPVIPPRNYYDSMNIQEEDLKDYETLQYDIMFGEQHGYTDFIDQILSENFIHGLGVMEITAVEPRNDTADGNETTIQVTGHNFPETALVLINGTQLETTFVSHEQLVAVVPPRLNTEGTAWNIVVYVMDSKDNILADAPVYTLQR